METIKLQTQVNADGSLILQLKDLPASENIEIVLVYQSISEQNKIVQSHQEPDPLIGFFSGSPDLAEESEQILETEITQKSGWTRQTS
jgi:hypothetical protein